MLKRVLLIATVAVLTYGCASTDKSAQQGAAVEDRAVSQARPAEPTTEARPLAGDSVRGNPLTDPANILSKRSVYFDVDSSTVKDEYRAMLEAHARYLAANPNTRVTLQGNCDETGSREYNLALGQRRADAVKQVLTVLGVRPAQIETVSFGEEKPKATGHDEAAYRENRRTDIVYPGE